MAAISLMLWICITMLWVTFNAHIIEDCPHSAQFIVHINSSLGICNHWQKPLRVNITYCKVLYAFLGIDFFCGISVVISSVSHLSMIRHLLAHIILGLYRLPLGAFFFMPDFNWKSPQKLLWCCHLLRLLPHQLPIFVRCFIKTT